MVARMMRTTFVPLVCAAIFDAAETFSSTVQSGGAGKGRVGAGVGRVDAAASGQALAP
jgi:hypothetical protein